MDYHSSIMSTNKYTDAINFEDEAYDPDEEPPVAPLVPAEVSAGLDDYSGIQQHSTNNSISNTSHGITQADFQAFKEDLNKSVESIDVKIKEANEKWESELQKEVHKLTSRMEQFCDKIDKLDAAGFLDPSGLETKINRCVDDRLTQQTLQPAVDAAVNNLHSNSVATAVHSVLHNDQDLHTKAVAYGKEKAKNFTTKVKEIVKEELETVTNEADKLLQEKQDELSDLLTKQAATIIGNLHGCLNTQLTRHGKSAAAMIGELHYLQTEADSMSNGAKVWLGAGELHAKDVPQEVTGPDGTVTVKPIKTKLACVLIGASVLPPPFLKSLRGGEQTRLLIMKQHAFSNQAYSSSKGDYGNTRSAMSSVRLDKCLEANLDKLADSPTCSEFVSWWDNLQKRTMAYGIHLCPLDAWDIETYGDVGFLIPGMGISTSKDISSCLGILLEDLLPSSSSMQALFIRSNGSGTLALQSLLMDEYKFLHPDHSLLPPTLSPSQDVSILALDIYNYSRMLGARGQGRTDKATTRHYLTILAREPAFASAAASYLGQVDRANHLKFPPHLRIMSIAKVMADLKHSTNSSSSITPYHGGGGALVQKVSLNVPMDLYGDVAAGPIQGCVHKTLSRNNGGNGGRRSRKPPQYHEVNSKKFSEALVICEACKRPGHQANRCFLLAQMLWVLKYERQNPRECALYAKEWEEDQRRRAERRSKSSAGTVMTPQVAMAYCQSKSLSPESAFASLDWDYLDCDDPRAYIRDEGDYHQDD